MHDGRGITLFEVVGAIRVNKLVLITILLVWMKLDHALALEVRAQPLYVVLLVINLWTN
jgi:hypothetical protein